MWCRGRFVPARCPRCPVRVVRGGSGGELPPRAEPRRALVAGPGGHAGDLGRGARDYAERGGGGPAGADRRGGGRATGAGAWARPGLAPVLGAARLAVAPLRFGAGIKGKVLEARAAGLACARTPIAAEGLPLTQMLAGCAAEDTTDLAGLIVALHSDAARNAALARAGKAALRQQFSQRSVETALAEASDVKAKNHRRNGNVRTALGRGDTCPASAAAIVFDTRSAARREGSFCT